MTGSRSFRQQRPISKSTATPTPTATKTKTITTKTRIRTTNDLFDRKTKNYELENYIRREIVQSKRRDGIDRLTRTLSTEKIYHTITLQIVMD